MKLQRFEINGFGKLNNRDIKLCEGLNVFYGANEAGKSTLMAFIKAMLYGLKGGKPQKGEALSDLKRYKPWQGFDYGGALEYRLDSGQDFRVVRNFETNTVKLYDSSFNEISNCFACDRDRGILFAQKQTGFDETCFEKTAYIKQMGLRFDCSASGEFYQRLMNLSSTGYEEYSVQKAEKALKDALKNYVGTEKTTTRPFDIVTARIDELKLLRESLIEKRSKGFFQQNEGERLKGLKRVYEAKIQLYIRLNELMDSKKQIENQWTDLDDLKELFKEINDCRHKLNNIVTDTNNISFSLRNPGKKQKIIAAGFLMVVLVGIIVSRITENAGLIPDIVLLIGLVAFIGIIAVSVKVNSPRAYDISDKYIKSDYDKRLENLQSKVQTKYFIEGNDDESIKFGIENIEEKLRNEEASFDIKLINLEKFCTENGIAEEYNILVEKYLNPDVTNAVDFDADYRELFDKLAKIEGEISRNEVYVKEGIEVVERLQVIDEEITELEEKKDELADIKKALSIAIEVLEQSSLELTKDFLPSMNIMMSDMISSITGGRYRDLRADRDFALRIMEPVTKDIVDAMLLSGGTIDQIYLALRLSAIKALIPFGETIPVLLDEVFAFYDDSRVEESVKFLLELSKDSQILLFTSRYREVDAVKSICGKAANIQTL